MMASCIHLYFLLIFIIFYKINCVFTSPIQCLDESGDAVDWFVVYKLPKISHQSRDINNGTAYMYITSKTLEQGWTLASNNISSKQSLVGRTLKPIYQHVHNSLWITYNDQDYPPSGINYGHTKGVIAADYEGGFWLIHSVPSFPSTVAIFSSYSFPNTAYKNGQSMLCVSLPISEFNVLGVILMYNKPRIMDRMISAEMRKLCPTLVAAANGETMMRPPWKLQTDIFSKQQKQFSNFAKATKFDKDLYEWVAKTFKTDILAETWQNEIHPLPSSCDLKYHVYNVEQITFKNLSVTFSSHKDHSKWAISQTSTKPWVCIGDINRALRQERRGGGTTCLENLELWKAYRDIATKTSNCKKRKNLKN